MAIEIERKFLVKDDSWKQYVVKSTRFIQAYLSHRPEGTVRLRILEDKAFLTVKGKTAGIKRPEWEYEIPIEDAIRMFDSKVYEGEYLEKTRNIVVYKGAVWEVDVFHGRHDGLVLAEIELEDTEIYPELPPFVGREVSDDPRYFNSNLNLTGLS